MPRACSICTHSKTAEITKALVGGGTNRELAERYDSSTAAIQRHRVNCLRSPRKREPPPEAPQESGEHRSRVTNHGTERFDSNDPKTLVSMTARLVDEALDLLEHAKRAEDRRTALTALKEARDGLALLMRVAGLLQPETAVNIAIDQRRQAVGVLANLTEDELRALAVGKPIEAPADAEFATSGQP